MYSCLNVSAIARLFFCIYIYTILESTYIKFINYHILYKAIFKYLILCVVRWLSHSQRLHVFAFVGSIGDNRRISLIILHNIANFTGCAPFKLNLYNCVIMFSVLPYIYHDMSLTVKICLRAVKDLKYLQISYKGYVEENVYIHQHASVSP